jgi:hypothetical protein
VGRDPTFNDVRGLELVGFLKPGESRVIGETMAERAKHLEANAGQDDLEWLLEHQEGDPLEWIKYQLVAPGTKWRTTTGDQVVPCLLWEGCQWVLEFSKIESGYCNHLSRLLRVRKDTKATRPRWFPTAARETKNPCLVWFDQETRVFFYFSFGTARLHHSHAAHSTHAHAWI